MALKPWWNSLSRIFAPRKLAIWAILSFIVSIAGPFGTFGGMVWPLRLAYWAGLIGLSLPVHYFIRILVGRIGPGLNFWAGSVIIGLAFSAVFTPIVWVITDPLAERGMVTLVPLWVMALVNLLASAVVRSVHGLWHHDALDNPAGLQVAKKPPAATPPTPSPAQRQLDLVPKLLLRLDADKRGTVQHLSVRDHYVVVQTDRGQSTLLMRFADALGELDGIEGMRVHRSHWVAKTAVAGLERSGGKLQVRLRDGRLVPVSRSYRVEVEATAEA